MPPDSNVAVRIAAVCIAASPGIKNDNALLKNVALLPGGIVGSLLARLSSQDEILDDHHFMLHTTIPSDIPSNQHNPLTQVCQTGDMTTKHSEVGASQIAFHPSCDTSNSRDYSGMGGAPTQDPIPHHKRGVQGATTLSHTHLFLARFSLRACERRMSPLAAVSSILSLHDSDAWNFDGREQDCMERHVLWYMNSMSRGGCDISSR